MASQVAVGIEMNEAKLIRAGQRGDSQAVDTLFRRYHRPLFQTALRVLGNAEDAEDALQEGMLSAYRNLKRFEGRSQFSTWLTRIVINAALMRRRSMKADIVSLPGCIFFLAKYAPWWLCSQAIPGGCCQRCPAPGG